MCLCSYTVAEYMAITSIIITPLPYLEFPPQCALTGCSLIQINCNIGTDNRKES